ncbi:MAG: nuclear transport factor 2 family protein [Acidobacteriota bacterium]|nr:nuclear transport factor 2 family protein [Acidobacteriota bacterium]
MKKIFTITFTITLMILAVSSFTLGQTGDEAAVIQLEQDIYKAAGQGDAKMLDRIWADEFTATFNGSVATKQDLLANLPKSPDRTLTTDFSEMKARVFGDAAVLTGVITFKSKDAGKEDVRYSRFTDTFVRRKNGWQLVAAQLDEVPAWQARKLEDTELKKLSALGCSGESSLKSLNSDVDTYIRFNNATAQTVVVN